jgi:hypothetical protein
MILRAQYFDSAMTTFKTNDHSDGSETPPTVFESDPDVLLLPHFAIDGRQILKRGRMRENGLPSTL